MGTDAGLRIAFIEQTAELGGAQFNALILHEGLNRRGLESLAVCPLEGPLTRELARRGVEVAVVPGFSPLSTSVRLGGRTVFNPFAFLYDSLVSARYAWSVAAALRRARADLALTNGMLAHFYGGLAARIAGVPCVWHLDDILRPGPALKAMGVLLRGAASALASAVIVPSRAVRSAMLTPSFPENRVAVIHNGVDLKAFHPDAAPPALREEFGIGPEEVVVGVLGRLVPWKGHREFLRAAAILRRTEPRTRFLIVGDTTFGEESYAAELKALARELGVEGRVVFAGFRGDTPACLAAMDICVLPSIRAEPFGRALCEAMAMAKPVVATSGGGVPEVVADRETGLLVPPGDVGALAEAILTLTKDPDLRGRMGRSGRRRAECLFSSELFVDRHCEFLEKVGREREA